MATSAIPGFFEKSRSERIRLVKEFAGLTDKEAEILQGESGGIAFENADKMVENAVGKFCLPLGIATNFVIDGRDVLVPMAIEEPSVVAAASKGAKTARVCGGFATVTGENISIGQVQLLGVSIRDAASKVAAASKKILDAANAQSKTLYSMGKGAKEVSCREIATDGESMVIVELFIDVSDAMGANVTNSMCEAVAPIIEEVTGGRVLLRILSNYSVRRLVRATATFDRDMTGGEKTVSDMILAYQFAKHDVYRAVTHNKGIMNGCIAVANATGQDSRAIEAAANAYAARTGQYRSLSDWSTDADGNLVGSLEIPISVGTVGGVANVHPAAKTCMRILGVQSARELAGVIVAAGLAQNFGAMRALVSEGIQRGHMRLHARNLAAAAGAAPEKIDGMVKQMISENRISLERARELAGA